MYRGEPVCGRIITMAEFKRMESTAGREQARISPRSRRHWLRTAVLGAAAAWLAADPAAAQVAAEDPDRAARMALRFGVLPIGGTLDSRNDWAPLLADLERTLGRPVTMFSASSYGALARAIERDEVDIAFLSGEMALEAVTRRGMRVVAQVTRHDGLPGYRAILLVRAEGPRSTLAALLADPDSWRMARGEKHSLSGFIVPQLEFFLPHRIEMETRFASEIVGTHQRIALAVANGEADIATSNTADFERFQLQFPEEAARLRIIWSSDLIPHGQIVMRRTFSPALRRAVQDFLTGYGRAPSPKGDGQRAVLKALHDLAGFIAADNRSLLPAASIAAKYARQQARQAQWINEEARQARFKRIDAEYAAQVRMLTAE